MKHWGKYRKRRLLLKRALKIYKEHYGPEHLEVAKILDDLGNSYADSGYFYNSQRFFNRALKIFIKSYGWNDPRLIPTLDALDTICEILGDFDNSEILREHICLILERHSDFNDFNWKKD